MNRGYKFSSTGPPEGEGQKSYPDQPRDEHSRNPVCQGLDEMFGGVKNEKATQK
jgi:hypothetical protein